jgi:pyridinium-3,5-biscarboxylic acid mononucleotide synthase
VTGAAESGAGGLLRRFLEQVAAGQVDVETALRALQPTADLGFANVDLDRARRCGLPEVVYCPGKRPADTAEIAAAIAARSGRVLLTRADAGHAAAVMARLPGAVHHERAGCLSYARAAEPLRGQVAVVAAGTADLPVAEEAAVTAEFCGRAVQRHVDVGVAGLHRLLERLPEIRRANVVIAVAGMDGALPSVLAGLLERPLIAVPTSTGYGASFGGLAPLLTMLNACAAGVAVVNIDNGFGAGYLAALIDRRIAP